MTPFRSCLECPAVGSNNLDFVVSKSAVLPNNSKISFHCIRRSYKTGQLEIFNCLKKYLRDVLASEMTRPTEALQPSGLVSVTGLARAQLQKLILAGLGLHRLVGPTQALPNIKVIHLSCFPSSHFNYDIQRG